MGLSSSMWSSVSGLLAHGEKMNVIGNNIANVNTIGFKSQRMDFEDFMYQDGYSAGGPTQIGRGVGVNAVLGDFSQAAFEQTNDPMDLAIGGKGFFQVRDQYSDQVWYSRAGNFRFDREGYLRLPSGQTLQGWKIDNSNNPTIATGANPVQNVASAIQGSGVPTDIRLDTWTVPPKQTTKVSFSLNLTSDPGNDKTASDTNPMFALSQRWNGTQPPNPAGSPPLSGDAYAYQTSLKVYDEGGTAHTLTAYFDQINGTKVTNLPGGSKMYEYIVTMDPSEDQRTYGGLYDPITGTLQDGLAAWETGKTIAPADAAAAAGAKGIMSNNAAVNGKSYQDALNAVNAALTAGGHTNVTSVGIIQYPSGGWSLDPADPDVVRAKAVAAPNTLDPGWTTRPTIPTDRLDNINRVKKFSESASGGVLMKGTITFNAAGQVVNQTAYTYMGNTTLPPDTVTNADPNDPRNWQPAAVSSNGQPVFSANFTGHPLANTTRQDTLLDKPSAKNYLIEFDLGLKCTGNLNDPWGAGGPYPPGDPNQRSIADLIVTPPALADYNDLTQFINSEKAPGATTCLSGKSVTQSSLQDGYTSGSLSNTSVDKDGILYGIYSNGVTLPLYQITMYDFVDKQALRREGGNLFSATRESGNPQISAARQGGMGDINSYSIEQSNVDMAREFVQMITTQRGFQANSKGITTVDTMLEQVINMKR